MAPKHYTKQQNFVPYRGKPQYNPKRDRQKHYDNPDYYQHNNNHRRTRFIDTKNHQKELLYADNYDTYEKNSHTVDQGIEKEINVQKEINDEFVREVVKHMCQDILQNSLSVVAERFIGKYLIAKKANPKLSIVEEVTTMLKMILTQKFDFIASFGMTKMRNEGGQFQTIKCCKFFGLFGRFQAMIPFSDALNTSSQSMFYNICQPEYKVFEGVNQHAVQTNAYTLSKFAFNKTFGDHFPRKQLCIRIMESLFAMAVQFGTPNSGIKLIGEVIEYMQFVICQDIRKNLNMTHQFDTLQKNQETLAQFVIECTEWYQKFLFDMCAELRAHTMVFLTPNITMDMPYSETGIQENGEQCIKAYVGNDME